MSEFQLVEGDFSELAWLNVFQSAAFFRLHAGSNGSYLRWIKDGEVLGCVHFTSCGDGHFRSPNRGTFAGYQFSPSLKPQELLEFHNQVEQHLIDVHHAKSIEILLAPMAHDPVAFSNQMYVLRSSGYQIDQCDLNHSLEINAQPFVERITYGNVKRIRKCRREEFFSARLGMESLGLVYETLRINRASKGLAMSMTLEQLEAMASTLPETLELFACLKDGVATASAICVRISHEVAYVFYWGDLPGYESYSPVVLLAEEIYSHFQKQGVSILDVGTSTLDAVINSGLIQFKRGLGFLESLKLRMRKDTGP